MGTFFHLPSLLLLLLLQFASGSPISFPQILHVESPSCPMDLSYVQRLSWDTSNCRSFNTSASYHVQNQTILQDEDGDSNRLCCQTLLSLIGVGLAVYLKETSFFNLPDPATSASCVANFQSQLDYLSLPSNLASTCFGNDTSGFVKSPNNCAGIQTRQDWLRKMGPVTPLDSACKSNLSDLTLCNSCVAAGFKVSSQLTVMDGNSSHATNCFYFTVLYAGGVVNDLGPEDAGTAGCIMGLAFANAPPPKETKHRSVWVFALTGAIVASIFMLCLLGIYMWWQHRKRKKGSSNRLPELGLQEEDGQSSSKPSRRPNTGSIWFKKEELVKATDNFSQKNLIGRGGFGVVYKGTLSDGSQVAVKQIIESDFQGDEEFCNEVEIISNLRHRNLVPLRGCCMTEEDQSWGERQRYLVYDYMPNGNLDDHIFPASGSPRKPLTWPQRKSIILDVAKGLAYLHYGVKPAIYHRDIKATNILLDGGMRGTVSDFGLVKRSIEGESHLTTRVAGTHGYLAPEYALYGQLTEKSDVFSFGVVVLEVMSGRRALDLSTSGSPRTFLITDWAWSLVKSGRIDEVFDVGLRSGGLNPSGVMERFVLVGVLCSHVMVSLRPTILEALKMLEGDIDVPELPDRPLPYGSGEIYTAGGTFSVSPMLSGPQLQSREMLR